MTRQHKDILWLKLKWDFYITAVVMDTRANTRAWLINVLMVHRCYAFTHLTPSHHGLCDFNNVVKPFRVDLHTTQRPPTSLFKHLTTLRSCLILEDHSTI